MTDAELLELAHGHKYDGSPETDRHMLRLMRAVYERAQRNMPTPTEVATLKAGIATAYGYLWLVNNEPGAPHQYAPEKAAYAARKALRELLTSEERGQAINSALVAVRGAKQ